MVVPLLSIVRRIAITLMTGLLCSAVVEAATESRSRPFSIDDYFKISRVTELAIAPDGEALVYVVKHSAADMGSFNDDVFIQTLSGRMTPEPLPVPKGSRKFQWLPDGSGLDFMASSGGVTQVFSVDRKTHAITQVTHASDPVTAFAVSPSGRTIAYATRKPGAQEPYFADVMHHGVSGVIINPDNLSVLDFMESSAHGGVAGAVAFDTNLWLTDREWKPIAVKIPGDVHLFRWSADGKRLSVVYQRPNIRSIRSDLYTSIGVLDVNNLNFTLVFEGRGPNRGVSDPGIGYVGGEWVRGSNKIVVLRRTNPNLWLNSHNLQWAIADACQACNTLTNRNWHEVYLENYNMMPVAVDDHTVLVSSGSKGTRSVYLANGSDEKISLIVASMTGSSTRISLSRDMNRAAFVNESMTRPPEIYLWEKKGSRVRKISALNGFIDEVQMPSVSRVHWTSSDGVSVEGWLLQPASRKGSGPLPLVTFLHGGPGFMVSDEFAGYFELWPYPLEVCPSYNMAVFLPNYRGTQGYGIGFAITSGPDREAVDDVRSGVQWLVDHGIADKERLGISGHSHGGNLGPIVMTRDRVFKAGSFAEGAADFLLPYEITPGLHAREVLDVEHHASLWDNPSRYVEMSADLHFQGLKTAFMTETGGTSPQALLMFPALKAARYFGIPAEGVAYPNTGHNPTLPYIQREISQRNLDWFRFWLQGAVDPAPSKQAQYERWRALADGSTAVIH